MSTTKPKRGRRRKAEPKPEIKYQTMQTMLGEEGYVILALPKDASLKFLLTAKRLVNFQIDTLLEFAEPPNQA